MSFELQTLEKSAESGILTPKKSNKAVKQQMKKFRSQLVRILGLRPEDADIVRSRDTAIIWSIRTHIGVPAHHGLQEPPEDALPAERLALLRTGSLAAINEKKKYDEPLPTTDRGIIDCLEQLHAARTR